MKVVYGHTDSIYVQMPIDKAEETLDLLNNHVRSQFPNLLGLKEHPVKLEFEKYFSTLGVGKTKIRNAGLIMWKDGKYLEEQEFVMTGFTAKRVAITGLAKRIQLEILKKWVNRVEEIKITQWLNAEYNWIIDGTIDSKELVQRSRYREERLTYMCDACNKKYTWEQVYNLRRRQGTSGSFCDKCGQDLNLLTLGGKRPSIGAGIEGVLWWNQNKTPKIDDSYLYMKVMDNAHRSHYMNVLTGEYKKTSYISAPTLEELLQHKPDYRHYAESIIKKAEPIYNAMGWDTTLIRHDRNQTDLNDWW